MSHKVVVGDSLEFVSEANNISNIKGNPAPEKLCVEYNFTELALDNTNKYTPYLDTTSTVALGSGGVVLTTAATDTKTCSQSQGGIWWYPAKNPVCEMTFKIDVITNVAIFAGFTDAVSEASSLLPFGITTATLTDTCTNGAGLLFDTLQTLSYFNVVQTNAGTQTFKQLASTYVPVANTNITVRTAIDSSGNARYYWNGQEVGYIPLAVAAATPLVPYVGIRNNSGTAHVLTLRRARCWCNV